MSGPGAPDFVWVPRAAEIAREAGAKLREFLARGVETEYKGDVDLVTIADRTVEIRGLAREAGYRTKIAVFSANPKVDPVGACVGMRGQRVKNIVRELNNEKVDIIRWTADVKEFVLEALKPAN